MRSNLLALGLGIVLGVGNPIIGAVAMPEVTASQSTTESQSAQLLAKGKQQHRQANFRRAIHLC